MNLGSVSSTKEKKAVVTTVELTHILKKGVRQQKHGEVGRDLVKSQYLGVTLFIQED